MYADIRKLALMQGTFQSSNNLIIELSQPETAGIAVLVFLTGLFVHTWGQEVTFFHMDDSYCKGVASLTSCKLRFWRKQQRKWQDCIGATDVCYLQHRHTGVGSRVDQVGPSPLFRHFSH